MIGLHKQPLRKKTILNIGGIILSLFLSFTVWYAVMFFIKGNENKILENQNTNRLVTITRSEATGYGIAIEKKFTSQTISDILTYWSKEAMSIHDVKEGQTSLEYAITTANDCVDYLVASGILKNITEEYSFNFALYGPTNFEALDNAEYYSYWNAVLINSYYTISFRINAVSGEIWYIKIATTKTNFNDINPEEALWIYGTYLNLSSLGPLYLTEKSAYKVYDSSYVSNVVIEENQILLQLIPY